MLKAALKTTPLHNIKSNMAYKNCRNPEKELLKVAGRHVEGKSGIISRKWCKLNISDLHGYYSYHKPFQMWFLIQLLSN